MKRIRTRFTYANVVATLALFVALAGGTAFAASRIVPKNSVGSGQIKKEAVGSAKLKKGAVIGAKIAAGAVTGPDIDLGTLGTVPSAADAVHATSADTAGHASTADTAADATQLAGRSASEYQGRVMWAYVSEAGVIEEQSGGISVTSTGTGFTILSFPREVLGKGIVATPAGFNSISFDVGVCGNRGGLSSACFSTADTASEAFVETFESQTTVRRSEPFYIAVLP